jgi:dipeptidyl aminopeptidase/acylaminoacyl peptidase
MRCPLSSRALAFGLLVGVVAGATAAEHRWTVRDSIELSVFLHPGNQFLQSSQVKFSPDGKHFIAATMRGDLSSGKRIATIWLFDRSQVDSYLKGADASRFNGGRPLLTSGSASNRDPINAWHFGADSRSVLYLAADDDGVRRLYRANIEDGKPFALSRPDQDISRFDERSGAIVYLAHKPIRADDLYQTAGPSLPDIVEATGENNLPLMYPNWMDAQFERSDDELWQIEHGRAAPVLTTDRQAPVVLKDSKLSLSPDGSKVLVTTFVHRIPKSWERYKPLIAYPGLQIVADTPETVGSTGNYRPKQYSVVDLKTGSVSLLAESPIDLMAGFQDAVTAAWTDDGSRIALPGAYAPLANAAGSGPIYPCTIAIVVLASKQFSCLSPQTPVNTAKHPYGSREQIVSLKWLDEGRTLAAQFAAPNSPDRKRKVIYTQGGNGKWIAKDAGSKPDRGLKVEVTQALDKPPVLVAIDGQGRRKTLLNPNPQLEHIARGTAALYHWRDAEGNPWTGALVKPPDFKAGHRYPLVIQTHNLDRASFLVDGPSATSFAARALAARDMLVLQVDEISKNGGTPKESETGAGGYRAAIKQLVGEGLVDPDKIGIITWSHMGPYVYQGLIDQPSLYKAATIAEADSNSYPEYLQNIDYMGTEREKMFRAQLGGEKPFGKGLQVWIRNSPGFHFDRICTPILMAFNSPVALQYGWNDYAALRAQDKPVDLLYIRNGDHVLVKPWQRLAEQGRNVDWYDYWLNGQKDPDPAKAARYKLWDRMKTNLPTCQKDNIPAL